MRCGGGCSVAVASGTLPDATTLQASSFAVAANGTTATVLAQTAPLALDDPEIFAQRTVAAQGFGLNASGARASFATGQLLLNSAVFKGSTILLNASAGALLWDASGGSTATVSAANTNTTASTLVLDGSALTVRVDGCTNSSCAATICKGNVETQRSSTIVVNGSSTVTLWSTGAAGLFYALDAARSNLDAAKTESYTLDSSVVSVTAAGAVLLMAAGNTVADSVALVVRASTVTATLNGPLTSSNNSNNGGGSGNGLWVASGYCPLFLLRGGSGTFTVSASSISLTTSGAFDTPHGTMIFAADGNMQAVQLVLTLIGGSSVTINDSRSLNVSARQRSSVGLVHAMGSADARSLNATVNGLTFSCVTTGRVAIVEAENVPS
jgi:hypothetical protein